MNQVETVYQTVTSKQFLGLVGGGLLANAGQKLAYKQFRPAFGFAVGSDGAVRIVPAKPGPNPTPDTANPSQSALLARQALRAALAFAGVAVAVSSKDEGIKGLGIGAAAVSAAHIVQDFIPPLR